MTHSQNSTNYQKPCEDPLKCQDWQNANLKILDRVMANYSNDMPVAEVHTEESGSAP